MLRELCSGIFGFSGFYLLIKKFLFPSFVLFFRNFPWYRAFGALLFSARNALIQMITTSLFASVVDIGASFNHNRALTAKFSLIFPPSTIAYNLFKLFVPLSPMKSRDRPFRRSWRIFFSLSLSKSLFSAAPQDLVRFPIWKDRKGKRKVHKSACPLFGSHSKKRCQCPVRLAAGTVDGLIGKLRSIFNNAGRAGPWCDLLGTGNPASHHSLKGYRRFLYQEQASSHVSPKQSVPIFLDKLWKLCQLLNHLAYLSCDTAPLNRYIFARDLAFFCVDFFSGDRTSDLGRTLTKGYCLFLTTKVLFLDNRSEKPYEVKIFMSSPSESARILSYAQSRLWIVMFGYASCSTLTFARDTFLGPLTRVIKLLKNHLSDPLLPLGSLHI